MATKLLNQQGKRPGRFLAFIDDYSDDDERVRFEKYKSQHRGVTLEVTITSRKHTGAYSEVRCDQGHKHLIPKTEEFHWGRVTLDEAGIQTLRDFLNDYDWCQKRLKKKGKR